MKTQSLFLFLYFPRSERELEVMSAIFTAFRSVFLEKNAGFVSKHVTMVVKHSLPLESL